MTWDVPTHSNRSLIEHALGEADPRELGVSPLPLHSWSLSTALLTCTCHVQGPSQTVLSSKAGAHLIFVARRQ